jgi:uncharacterized membrane protein YagU involved in acid resistance
MNKRNLMFGIGLQIIVSIFYFILVDMWQKINHFQLTSQGDFILFALLCLAVWLVAEALFPSTQKEMKQ